ncbi:hypothetical protein H920_14120 [Fukomys damarensis]|uniref:Uncharacterized protein n=1 Tax=Fukomys damarensis TaxID=885580 RepID=A0A091DNU4_FUKDA|nr:hypothetical protein H920_14120 [Fukomys damarensis]
MFLKALTRALAADFPLLCHLPSAAALSPYELPGPRRVGAQTLRGALSNLPRRGDFVKVGSFERITHVDSQCRRSGNWIKTQSRVGGLGAQTPASRPSTHAEAAGFSELRINCALGEEVELQLPFLHLMARILISSAVLTQSFRKQQQHWLWASQIGLIGCRRIWTGSLLKDSPESLWGLWLISTRGAQYLGEGQRPGGDCHCVCLVEGFWGWQGAAAVLRLAITANPTVAAAQSLPAAKATSTLPFSDSSELPKLLLMPLI